MKTIEQRLKELGVGEKAMESAYGQLDIGALITYDEFYRPTDAVPEADREKNYRKRAIERMTRDGIPFCSNFNLLNEMFEHFLQPVCNCGEPMQFSSASGSGAGVTFTFRCLKCKDEFEIMVANNALRYRPGKKREG